MTELAPVAKVSEIPDGWTLAVELGRRRLVVVNTGGTIRVLDGDCSHAGGPLGDSRLREGCLLQCPWHGATFDVHTGDPVSGPARSAVRTYGTHVADGIVYIALDPRC